MSANACPRCLKPLPEATRRALAQGTKCPFCAAPLKRSPPNVPSWTAAAPAPAPAPADDGYAAFELDGPPPPPAKPAAEGYASFEVSAPGARPVKVAPPASPPTSSLRATMVGGTGVGARDLPFNGSPAPASFSLAPPASAPTAAPQARTGAAALARTIAAPPPARTASARPTVAPAAGRPARTLTPAQALDRPPPTPAPVLKTPPPLLRTPPPAQAAVTARAVDSDSEPTHVAPPAAPEPAAATPLLTFPDSEPIIDSVTVTPDMEAPPPATVTLPAPAEPRRGIALIGVGMGIAIVALAIGGFKLLRGPRSTAAPVAATAAKHAPQEEAVAPTIEAVKPESPPEQPIARAAPASAKTAPASARAAPAAAKTTTPTPATTLAPQPGRRAAAKPIVEKAAPASHRHVATRKERPHPRRASHARAVAMRDPAAKKSGAAGSTPEHADPRPPYEHGNALLFAGDGKGAIAAYREAVRSAPSDPIGFRGLGLAYEQQGETALAIRALRRYLKLAPDAPDHDIIARRVDKLSKRAKQK